MAASMQAYFFTENDAEDVRMKLQKLKVQQVKVDEIPGDTDYNLLIPLQSGSTGSGGRSIIPGAVPFKEGGDEETDPSSVSGKLNYIVEFEVDDSEVEDALALIQENNGYMDKNTMPGAE
ncbi:hypothetical protein [Salibacterium qingdaonense]|uniref:Heat induced stress protein YflT n=1 Tax=Salibacterium qingdaonense TaxID=266892 RepID=A0A1I4K3A9_9BACI|nr:hypothetical protein [Salibacterium qingdaonense]SFL73215.1 hypothetical protein SAMN04488054_10487 [Salibacterium qingdaonense]